LDKHTRNISLFSDKLHKEVSYCVDLKILDDDMWIASRGLFRYNLKTGRVHAYYRQSGDSASLSHDNVMKLLVDSKKRLWIATNGGGINLYDPKTDTFRNYNSRNAGLKNDYISNLMESK